jgi:hypothetical protein
MKVSEYGIKFQKAEYLLTKINPFGVKEVLGTVLEM